MERKKWFSRFIAIILSITIILLGGCNMNETESKGSSSAMNPQEAKEHFMAMTDMQGGIRVVNLDVEDPTSKEAVIWEWKPAAEDGWELALGRLERSIDDVKLRWSEYYQKKVVVMTASQNWAGIADYETGKCLWEAEVPYSPHGIEMLPNGDVVIAGSGGEKYMTEGCVMYYNITAGESCAQTDLQLLPSAHGLFWDPKEEVIWAVGWEHLAAYKVADNKLTRVEGKGCKLLRNNGHDISADYYDSDQLLITTGSKVYKFSKANNELLIDYNFSDVLRNTQNVKGITSFSDGTVAYCVATGVHTTFDTDTFYVIRMQAEDRTGIQYKYTMENFSMYKLKNFTVDYQ